MSVKVSVVVATYNSPPELDDLLRSLDEQSLPAEEYELVFVDDGSSDGTFDRLTRLAAERSNMVVDRIPNSGWPGRPRNVGTRLATGEYVFYADHDDYFFPEALERMHRFAVEHRLDVVHPKEVVKGWGRPGWVAFRHHVPHVEQLDQVVLQCITPHKLYRRAFVVEQDVWFPEGRVRLEDFSLNGLAWSRTDAIGVMADYPCYQWIIHQENSHKASYDYDVYWRSFVESLAPVLELPEGDKRDQLLIRWYKSRVLERVKALHGWPEDHVTRLLGTFAGLLPLFPPSLDAKLHPADRARSALLRTGDRSRLLALGELDHGHHLQVTSTRTSWADGRLQVHVEAEVVDRDGRPFALERVGDRVVRRVPDDLAAATDPALWDLTDDLAGATAELVVRSRETSVDWILPSTSRVEVTDDLRVRVVVAAEVDPATSAGGSRLGTECYDTFFRLGGLGYTATRRVDCTDDVRAAALVDGHAAVSFRTKGGALALDLSGHVRTVVGAVDVDRSDLTTTPRGSEIALPGAHVSGETDLPATVRVGDVEHPARLVGRDGHALLRVDGELAGHGPVRATVLGKTSAPMFRLAAPGDETGTDAPEPGREQPPLRSRIAGAVRRVRR